MQKYELYEHMATQLHEDYFLTNTYLNIRVSKFALNSKKSTHEKKHRSAFRGLFRRI